MALEQGLTTICLMFLPKAKIVVAWILPAYSISCDDGQRIVCRSPAAALTWQLDATEKVPMKHVDAMHRWLLYAAFAVLCTAPSAAYSAQGEGPDGPRRPYRPGKIVYKQVKISLPAQEYGNTCRASVQLRFTQSDDQARVDAAIENEDCAAATGKYELRLRITDARGERHTLRF